MNLEDVDDEDLDDEDLDDLDDDETDSFMDPDDDGEDLDDDTNSFTVNCKCCYGFIPKDEHEEILADDDGFCYGCRKRRDEKD